MPDNLKVPTVPSTVPATLLQRRPDVVSAARQVTAGIGIQRAAWFPTIGLTGNLVENAATVATLFSAPATLWSLGMTGALDLINFGARSARVDQQRNAPWLPQLRKKPSVSPTTSIRLA